MGVKSGKAKKTGKRVKNLSLKGKGTTDVKGGSFNSFVNFGDIKGESQESSHKDWIEVLSYKR